MAVTNTTGIDFAADIDEATGDLSSPLVYNGATVNVVVGVEFELDDVQEQGTLREMSVDVQAVVADFTAGVPVQRATVTLDGTKYYVATTQTDGHGETLILTLRRRVSV